MDQKIDSKLFTNRISSKDSKDLCHETWLWHCIEQRSPPTHFKIYYQQQTIFQNGLEYAPKLET